MNAATKNIMTITMPNRHIHPANRLNCSSSFMFMIKISHLPIKIATIINTILSVRAGGGIVVMLL